MKSHVLFSATITIALTAAAGCGGEEGAGTHQRAAYRLGSHALAVEATGSWEAPQIVLQLSYSDGGSVGTRLVLVDPFAVGADAQELASYRAFRAGIDPAFLNHLLQAIPGSIDKSDPADLRFKQVLLALLQDRLPELRGGGAAAPEGDGVSSKSSALISGGIGLPGLPTKTWPRPRPCDDCVLLLLSCMGADLPFSECWGDYLHCTKTCY